MNYISIILEILKTGLSIWDSKEKTKYLDLVISIERRFDEQRRKQVYVEGMPKDGDYRNDLIIDELLRELATISKGFAAASRADGATSV